MLENEILLIGLGNNKAEQGKIVNAVSADYVESVYGPQSVFLNAFEEIRVFSSCKIDILNLDSWEDIKDHDEELNDYNYDYVVPLDLYLDEAYFDEFYNIRMLYSQLLAMVLTKSMSTIIFAGKHASGFEDLDSYLDYENSCTSSGAQVFKNLRKENIVYIGNLLKNYSYANAVLAAVMTSTDYSEYPASSVFGEAYFDIDYVDVSNELVYFRNNHLIDTTIENLINFSVNPVTRLVPVYKIVKYFYYHHANVDNYVGTSYTEYKKMKILEAQQEFLESCVGWIIYKYEILSITPVLTRDGAVSISLSFNIWPKFTTESYTLQINL